MNKASLFIMSIAALTTAPLVGSPTLLAQSGSRSYPPAGSTQRTLQSPYGSSSRAMTSAPLALEGYCPVSVLEMRKWTKGDPRYQTVYDGHTYRFANEKGMQMFLANTAKYAPALGGDCVVALTRMGKRTPGNIRHSAIYEGRLFVFANRDAQQMFLADTKSYGNADLALNGNCAVCMVNMKQQVAGKPEFAAHYKGYRYLFPSNDQRQQFLASPEKFAAAMSATGRPTGAPAGSGSTSR